MDILGFRAPRIEPARLVELPSPADKSAAVDESGRLRIGSVRVLDKAAPIAQWQPVAGGYVARVHVSSEGAAGIRAKLALGTVPGAIDVRVKGDEDRVEGMTLEPFESASAWTPWTSGPDQVIEFFSPVRPSEGAVSVESVLHLVDSPITAKAAAACTVPTVCSTNDPAVDAAMAERTKSVVKVLFIDGGSGFLCTGTLINTERFPAGYLLTANHCINNADSAASLTTYWFYEEASCSGGGINPSYQQIGGGASLVFTNYNADSTLLLMNRAPAPGAVYSAWNRANVASGTSIVSLSHPSGDTMRVALGTTTNLYRIEGRPQDEYGVHYTLGIIQGGSSGSGLFTLNGSSLELRGILTGTTIRQPGGLSCTNLTDEGLYGRFDIFEPQIDQYIRLAAQAPDDVPNRVRDWSNVSGGSNAADSLNTRTAPVVLPRSIDYQGDVDVFRFTLTATSTVTVGTTGSMDTVGSILDSRGVNIVANDDVDANGQGDCTMHDCNFGITKQLDAGTYYVQVAPWDPAVTGPYVLNMTASTTVAADTVSYTDIWWNAAESGWGINLNHQGTIIFATLFTYDADGTPMWLVATNNKQPDGSYSGELYRTTGAPLNNAWFASTNTIVGTMRLAFVTAGAGTLTYVVNGTQVVKSITRQPLSASVPACNFTTSDRATATNFQDLWWNPSESGWGVNVNQQGNIVFATLFTYAPTGASYAPAGKGMWYVLNGNRVGTGNTFSGPLYRTTGAPFNAPWFADTPIQVGTMMFTFTSGNAGTMTFTVDGVTVTKSIQRQVFSTPTTLCQ
jgi:lysyl endopeptidase